MAEGVGIIGLGVIGKPIAIRIVRAGYAASVYDVREEPVAALTAIGARGCRSPAEVARHSRVILSLVSDAAQTHDVVAGTHGLLDALQPGSLFITGSTLGPAPVRTIAGLLAEHGCATLDAPISGGFVAAEQGTLSLMIGGNAAMLERALPLLRTFATAITHTGEIGAGQTAKLAHQLVLNLNILALLEGLALGSAGGVEPAIMKEVLKHGLANSTALQVWGELGERWKGMMTATPPGSPPPNLRKDLHLALEMAQSLGVPLFLGTQASLVADNGVATGHADPRL